MADYSFLIDQMTWSYSRIQSFAKCPHSFFVKYINGDEEDDTFLASFGSYVHQIHQLVFSGILKRDEASEYYIKYFDDFVTGYPPPEKVFSSYYKGGYRYFSDMPTFKGEIVGIETEFDFKVLGLPFRGAADLITKEDDGLVIYDHKAKDLKPYSNRRKPTKSDIELHEYTRQLYIYAEAVKQKFGEYPKRLVFNCYRTQTMIEQDFNDADLNETLNWAYNQVQEIRSFTEWNPDIDFFKCRYLCGLDDKCDYYDLI